MIYVSIDCETTGLDREKCHVIEFGAAIADSKKPGIIGTFHRVIRLDAGAFWEHGAEKMNLSWYLSTLTDSSVYKISPDDLLVQFGLWLVVNGLNPHKVWAAGKNFASFDLQFLRRMAGYGQYVDFHHRFLDPATLYFDPNNDVSMPGMSECCRRAGIVQCGHRALSEAIQVANLLSEYWSEK